MKEYKIKINGNDYAVSIVSVEDNQAHISVNGTEYEVEVEGMAKSQPKTPKLVQETKIHNVETAVAKTSSPVATASGSIKSPLPGVILDVLAKVGDRVKTGQRLLVLEAMKMENNIDADRDGTVTAVQVRKGDSVLEGDVLISIS